MEARFSVIYEAAYELKIQRHATSFSAKTCRSQQRVGTTALSHAKSLGFIRNSVNLRPLSRSRNGGPHVRFVGGMSLRGRALFAVRDPFRSIASGY